MIKYILRHGMTPEKLVLGVPLYGRSYTLAPSTLPAPGALVSDWGEEGPYTQIKGLLSYFEVSCRKRDLHPYYYYIIFTVINEIIYILISDMYGRT